MLTSQRQTAPPKAQISIDYDEIRKRFHVSIPFFLQALSRGIPNRRWNGRLNCFEVPAFRANVAYIRDKLLGYGAVCTEVATRALEELDPAKHGGPSPQAPPRGFLYKTKPFPHQLDALKAGYGLPAFALFCEMGVGKTKIIIDEAVTAYREGIINGMLVLCPCSLRRNWVRQLETHSAIQFIPEILDGSRPKYKRINWHPKPRETNFGVYIHEGSMPVLICGIESLSQGGAYRVAETFMLENTAAAVCDESSTIANPQAIRSKRAYSIARMAKYRRILNGTPVSQGPIDLYGQFEFLDPDIIGVGSWYAFRNQYAVMGGFEHKQIVGYQNLDELMDLIRPYSYQKTKAEVMKYLPAKLYAPLREVPLSPAQQALYDAVQTRMAQLSDGASVKVENVLELQLREQQIVGGHVAAYDDAAATAEMRRIEGKIPRLEETVEICRQAAGSAIIWTRFKPEVRMIAERLEQEFPGEVRWFHGDVKDRERFLLIEAFQRKEFRFLIATQMTGGMGHDMFAATTMVFYSNTFSYRERIQAEDRAHRQGQTKSVLYVDLVAPGTVDEDLQSAFGVKQDMAMFVRESLQQRRGIK